MYNTDFLPQLKASQRHLFGYLEPTEAVKKINNYVPPKGIIIVECEEYINGEWVPHKALEKKVNST